MRTYLLFAGLLLGCGDKDSTEDSASEMDPMDIDDDGDGFTENDGDCDDDDPNLLSIAEDADCDGILTADDCDDTDPESTVIAEDGDCDGHLTTDDCDDADPNSTLISEDGDCDGLLTADDCDDTDPESTSVLDDTDCDGWIASMDCDDADPSVGFTDGDGDGFAACIDDCDDANVNAYPGAGYNESDPTLCVEDADGDGYGLILEGVLPECVTINMYDDGEGDGTWLTAYFEVYEDDVLTATYARDSAQIVNGVHSVDHCFAAGVVHAEIQIQDDTQVESAYMAQVDQISIADTQSGTILGSGSGGHTELIGWDDWGYLLWEDVQTFGTLLEGPVVRGLVNGTDCDDQESTSTNRSTDGDCDGVLQADDCDDQSAQRPALDADCDGVTTSWDCDDSDPAVTNTSVFDSDCDGVDTMDDCDDSDPTMPNDDADCDGSLTVDDCDDSNVNVYPGAGYNESDPTLCVEDADGDGYGSIPVNALPDCITFNMFDDGAPSSWSSVFIEVTEDSTSTTTYALNAAQIQNGVHSEEHCFSVGTVQAEIRLRDDFNQLPFQFYSELGEMTITDSSSGNILGHAIGGYALDWEYHGDDSGYFLWNGVSNGSNTTILEGDVVSGLSAGSDCDDSDGGSTLSTVDADCDGVLATADCDDLNVTMPGEDADCDRVFTDEDCDDNDPNEGIIYPDDGDCDGLLWYEDCDDNDATVVTNLQDDGDCDGVLTSDDCDDSDYTDAAFSGDCDQDGVLTADDCDDFDASTVNDMDCDGSLTADDCDDNNPNTYPGAGFNESDPTLCVEDADGDGYGGVNNGTSMSS